MAKKKKEAASKINEEEVIKNTIREMMNLLEIDGDFDLSLKDDEAEIQLDTKATGIVIGYHGEILESLQLILSLCISKKIGRFIRVSIEVGDYKKNRIDYLENLTVQMKERVNLERKEVALPNLKSWERRIVHMLLQEDKDVVSESIGEGKTRTLVIKPK